MTIKAAIVFGASEGGQNFIENQEEYNVLAVADNDSSKQGNTLGSYKIINPNEIKEYDYDHIIIASMYVNQILKQLTEDLNVDRNKIIIPSKQFLKASDMPFEDPSTLKFAKETLYFLIDNFNRNKIEYFIDFGVLLGIVRDGEIIPWDDDIDISIQSDNEEMVVELIKEIIPLLNKNGAKWSGTVIYLEKDKPSVIDLKFESTDFKKFKISIAFISFEKGMAVTYLNVCPEYHFLKKETIAFEGKLINVPFKYEEYLEYTYGDWKTPRKNTTFQNNTKSFKEPEEIYKVVEI